jgi:molecular chaperone GrpE
MKFSLKRYIRNMATKKEDKDTVETDMHQAGDNDTGADQENDAQNETGETEVEKLEALVKVEKEKFLRLFAEFENYKRRTAKERIELFKTAGEGVIKDMLPVLDDFDRGMIEIRKSQDAQLTSGVELISNKLRATLIAKGLEECAVEAGDVFDADMHEAITQIPAPSDDMKGKIVDVVEKGYKLGDKIIRYPKVVIGQ